MGLQCICCGFAKDLHGFVVDLLRICNVCVMGLQLFVCICCGFVCICMGLLFDLYEFALESYGVGSVIYIYIYIYIYMC